MAEFNGIKNYTGASLISTTWLSRLSLPFANIAIVSLGITILQSLVIRERKICVGRHV